MARIRRCSRCWLCASAALATSGVVLATGAAQAQQHTPHLDRLEVPGAPDDGLVLFRPVTRDESIFYAQVGIGSAVDPLRMGNLINDTSTLHASPVNAVTSQFSTYLSAGVEVLNRLTFGATFPSAWIETGNQPSATFFNGNQSATTYSTGSPAVGDTRFDVRWVVWRDEDGSHALGLQGSIWAPTGAGSASNFGGDPGAAGMLMVTGELNPHWKLPLIFVANTGPVFRPETSVNDPAGTFGRKQGLGVSDEWRLAIGAFMPIFDGKYRLGATIFGQTGIKSDNIVGNTAFTSQNTPLEWNVEARMMKLSFLGERWFAGAGAGTRLLDGYGGPDFRLVALLGTYLPIEETNARSPEARVKMHMKIAQSLKDTDGDGIPDEIDACPEEPEDHKDPDPGDGCPAPSDRDGDGIPDQYDKCPDEPEDKDGIDDYDGCPEVDADNDGIPDAKDACPKEPGPPDPDPKKNGCPRFIHLESGQVRVLQQVHFQTASATILPDSFPMLLEVAQLLKANPTIKKMRIEGHTDNRGGADMNLDLSKRRAASVRTWLIEHGIDPGRLDSEGYGLTVPIQTNDTDEGRAANRRVEFKITEEDMGGPPQKPQKAEPPSAD